MQNTTTVSFALLRSAIKGEKLNEEERALYNAELLPSLFSLAKKHDILPIVVVGLLENHLLDEGGVGSKKASQARMQAVYRYEQIQYELGELCTALEQAEIPFMPLKGSVLRAYYPEPWMRTSCDIDVLVREQDVERAIVYLVENCGYTRGEKGTHDVSLYSLGGVHLELHHTLVEEGVANESCAVLEGIWETTDVEQGCVYRRKMTDEAFYFYHIAHMAKHIQGGGCGIRPFIDLWILDNVVKGNESARETLLKQGKLWRFTEQAKALCAAWLDGKPHTPVTERLQEYILDGGVYGTMKNKVLVRQQKRGGKFRYLLSRIWLPYYQLKYVYPSLTRHKWLFPFYQVRRWGKLFFGGRAKRTAQELRCNVDVSKEEAERMKVFLEDVGL